MDKDNDNGKTFTRAGGVGSPSAGIGGVLPQAPPLSSSGICESSGVDPLPLVTVTATREGQLMTEAGAGSEAATRDPPSEDLVRDTVSPVSDPDLKEVEESESDLDLMDAGSYTYQLDKQSLTSLVLEDSDDEFAPYYGGKAGVSVVGSVVPEKVKKDMKKSKKSLDMEKNAGTSTQAEKPVLSIEKKPESEKRSMGKTGFDYRKALGLKSGDKEAGSSGLKISESDKGGRMTSDKKSSQLSGETSFTREQLIILEELDKKYTAQVEKAQDIKDEAMDRTDHQEMSDFEDMDDDIKEIHREVASRLWQQYDSELLLVYDIDAEIERTKTKFLEENKKESTKEMTVTEEIRKDKEEEVMEVEVSGYRIVTDQDRDVTSPGVSGVHRQEDIPMEVDAAAFESSAFGLLPEIQDDPVVVPMSVDPVVVQEGVDPRGSAAPEREEEKLIPKELKELSKKKIILKPVEVDITMPNSSKSDEPKKEKELLKSELKKNTKEVITRLRLKQESAEAKKKLSSDISATASTKSGPKIVKIMKLNPATTDTTVDKQFQLSKALKKMQTSIDDMAQYIQSNKNMRVSYKELAASLPKELKKIRRLHSEMVETSSLSLRKETPVRDASIMTSPTEEKEWLYPMERCREERGMECTFEAEPGVSFADVLRQGPARKKLRMETSSGEDRELMPPPASRLTSSDDEEDLERAEELLRLNIDLLLKQQELKTYVQGLKEMDSFLLEAKAKTLALKKDRCDPDKIAHTLEVIDKMQAVVGRNRKGDRKGDREGVLVKGMDKEARQRRKQEQEEEWVSVVKKGLLPKTKLADKIEPIKITNSPIAVRKDSAVKKPIRPRWSVTRPDAIMIPVTNADEFKDVYSKIDKCPKSTLQNIKRIRKTKVGNLLIELDKNCNVAEFRRGLSDVMDTGAVIKTLQKSFELEVKDIEPVITKETITATLATHLDTYCEDLKIKIIRETQNGSRIAVVDVPTRLIDRCLEKPEVRIGHSLAKLTPCPKIVRCFRCLAIGHYSAGCVEKLDGNIRCKTCGRDGHGEDACQEGIRCRWCAEQGRPLRSLNHKVNTMACPLFREVMSTQKERLRLAYASKMKDIKSKERRKGQRREAGESTDQSATPRSNIRDSVIVQTRLTPSRSSMAKRKKPQVNGDDSST